MERQRLYNQRVVAQPGQVRGANVVGPPAGHDWADNLLKTVAGAGSDIMRVIAHDYVRNENALMQEALINADTKFESWKQDYMKEHQGQGAQDAQRDFVRKYGEIRQETMDLFQGHDNEIFRQKLDQSLGMRALHALQTGGAYQEQQDEIWQKSVFEGTMSSIRQDVWNNADNPAFIDMRMQEGIQAIRDRFPGQDVTAKINDFRESMMADQVNSLLASGMNGNPAALDEAEKLLGKNPGASAGPVSDKIGDGVARWESGKDGIQAIGYDPNGGTSYGKWQLSSKQGSYKEWIDHLEKTGEKGAAIAKELRAAGASNTGSRKGHAVDVYKRLAAENSELFEQSQREYLTKSHYGRAMSSIPANARSLIEGNKALQEMVFSTSVQHGGGGAARIIKRAWKEGMSEDELVRAVYAGRANPGNFASTPSGMAQNITGGRFPEERDYILSQLAGGKAATQPAMQPGASPALAGLSPEKQMTYRNKIDAVRRHTLEQEKAAQQAALAQNVQNMISSTSMLSKEQQEVAVLEEVNQIKDPALRKKAQEFASSGLAFQEKLRTAKTSATIYDLVSQARANINLAPLDFAQQVATSGLRPEDQQKAIKMYRGDITINPFNMKASAELRTQIDNAARNGQKMSNEDIYTFAYNNNFTDEQLKQALEYNANGGNLHSLSQEKLNKSWLRLQAGTGKAKEKKDVPSWLYSAALMELKSGTYNGKELNDDVLDKIVSRLIAEGNPPGLSFGTMQRGEAMVKGKLKGWQPVKEDKNGNDY